MKRHFLLVQGHVYVVRTFEGGYAKFVVRRIENFFDRPTRGDRE